MSTELRHTPLHDEHLRLGARLVAFAGFELPIQYSGLVKEHHAVRKAAGIFDVSHMGELEVKGREAAALVNRVVTGDVARLSDGQALYTVACNDQGTILDDLIVYRRASDELLVVCNASNRAKMAAHFVSHGGPGAQVRDASDDYALIALQGPRAFSVWERAGGTPGLESSLPSFHHARAEVAGVPVLAARTGYTGEDGLELFVGPARARAVFTGLQEAGEPLGLLPAGLGARDTLRLEARLSLYGNDIDETTNPLEAGLGWVVKLEKPEFVGKAALLAIREAGLTRKLVGFEMTGRGIARHGYPLLDPSGNPVGTCTSGAPSPTLEKNIGLGYLPVTLGTVGSEMGVDCRGKRVPAVVVKTPFYRRSRGKDGR